jgi:hypothetical protein
MNDSASHTTGVPTKDPNSAAHPDEEFASHCIKCGRPTAPGVSLCELDNPGHIKAPSATQVHGTMLLGVGIGVIGFLLLAQLAVRHAGPFSGQVVSHLLLPTGSTQVELLVANTGADDSIATCRITRDGAPRPDDLVIRTVSIPAHGSVRVTRELPLPAEPPPYDPTSATLLCT